MSAKEEHYNWARCIHAEIERAILSFSLSLSRVCEHASKSKKERVVIHFLFSLQKAIKCAAHV